MAPVAGHRLESERLLLRPFVPDDFAALYALQSRPDMVRWLYWGPRDEDEVRDVLEKKIARTDFVHDGDGLSFAVVLKESGEVIGEGVLFLRSTRHRQGEIGFAVHPDHQGHGYATETGRLLLELAFGQFDLHRVVGAARAEEHGVGPRARAARDAQGGSPRRERVREGGVAE